MSEKKFTYIFWVLQGDYVKSGHHKEVIKEEEFPSMMGKEEEKEYFLKTVFDEKTLFPLIKDFLSSFDWFDKYYVYMEIRDPSYKAVRCLYYPDDFGRDNMRIAWHVETGKATIKSWIMIYCAREMTRENSYSLFLTKKKKKEFRDCLRILGSILKDQEKSIMEGEKNEQPRQNFQKSHRH